MKARERHWKPRGMIWIWMLVISMVASLLPVQQATVQAADGMQWQPVGSAGFSAGEADYPSIAIDSNGTPYVVYIDVENAKKATVKKYDGSNWVAVGEEGFSNPVYYYISIVIDRNDIPYVLYADAGHSNGATVMKYDKDNDKWVIIGGANFSGGAVDYPSIAIDSSGTPYVVYGIFVNGIKTYVKKYDESSDIWVPVGTEVSTGRAPYAWITMDSSGSDDIPYVAYNDGNNSNKATVKKYDESSNSWVRVGGELSVNYVQFTSIAIDSNGTPYVVYQDGANSEKAAVKKYNGSSWETVGSEDVSAGAANYTSIALDSSGAPYVVYQDLGTYKTIVKKLVGSSWETVGSGDVSAGVAEAPGIVINPMTNTPYVVYQDGESSDKTTVMKYAPILKYTVSASAATETPEVGVNNAITLTVKDALGYTDTTFNGAHDVTVSGYEQAPDGSYGSFNEETLTGSNVISVTFTNGVATANLKLNKAAAQTIQFSVADVATPATNTLNLTVTVAAALSSAKDITAFSFASPAATGTISGTNIALTVPHGTDVTALVASFTNSVLSTVKVGSVEQISSTTANDFTSPVAYTITAEDGSAQTYTVTVTVADPPTLTNAATPSIITQPADAKVNVSESSPTLSVAANVSDGGTLSYQWYSNTTNSNSGGVAITDAQSDSFAAPTTTAGTTYYYVVVTNTNNSVDGTKTATAMSEVATVTVNDGVSPNASLSNLSLSSGVLSPTFASGTMNYTAIVPYDVSVITATYATAESHVTVAMSLNGAPVNNPISLNVGLNIISFIVTVQDDTEQTYIVNVTREAQLVTAITVSSARGTMYVGDSLQFSASVTPDNATDKTFSWSVVPGTGAATIHADGLLVATQAGTVTVQATAHDGSGIEGSKVITISNRPTSNASDTSTTATQPTTEPEQPSDSTSNAPRDVFRSNVVQGDVNVVENIEARIQEAKNAPDMVNFSDTKGHWSEKTIDVFVKLRVIEGYSDGTFKPNGNITRAEFAMILSRVFDITSGDNANAELKDVGSHWAKEAIEKLTKAGVISGYGDGMFRPDRTITREEMVIMLSRIVNLNNVAKDTSKGNFNDLNGTYAAGEIEAGAQAGIISGKGGGKFDPHSNATRAEALQIILNALKLNPQVKTLLDSLS